MYSIWGTRRGGRWAHNSGMQLRTLRSLSFLFLLLAVVTRLSATPVVSTVMNAAGNISPTLPNGPLAPGVIFIIKGTGLGPATISISDKPFQNKTLSGTSVKVTIGTTTVDALMYYTSATQIAALLPSNTPPSSGAASSVTVTYNGQSSPATPFRGVATNSMHLFTLDSTGQGLAIVTYADYSLVSATRASPCGGPNTACGAANPGDTLILWATGLGAVPGDDAAGSGLGQNMPNVPLVLRVGGVQATIAYQGRSGCCIGEDQIVFTVPANVPTGCAVPVVAQIGNQISNSTVMPVAAAGRNCTPSFGAVDVAQFANVSSVGFGDIGLQKDFNSTGNGTVDKAAFEFDKIGFQPNVSPFFMGAVDSPPPGTCIVSDDTNPGNETFGLTGLSTLDAGSSLSIKGPTSTVNVPSGGNATISATGAFLVPGSFTVTGAGGKDVGPFSATLTIPTLPNLTGPVSGNTFNRSAGIVFTWNGGTSGIVDIEVSAAPDAFPTQSATVHCSVLASAGTFTVPGYLLLALPATNNAGNFSFSFEPQHTLITATGVNVAGFHANIVRGGGSLKLQ
jgi:uncharacterized protein (TIGR03437 family)